MEDHITTYGIIGSPVKHSLSPDMHNAAFKALGVEAVYKLFPLENQDLESFLSGLRIAASSIFGLNVTVPYKEQVIPFLDNLSPFADKVKAVNTIVVEQDRRLIGHNTDGPGFLAHLKELKVELRGKRVALLGAGGTARAILAALVLMPEGVDQIRLFNRTTSKAQSLVNDLGARMDMSRVEVVPTVEDLNIELADILVNTTSVGMDGREGRLVHPEMMHSHLWVYDVIYAPRETPLLKEAKRQGCRTVNGLGMLFYQGVLALQHWAQQPLPDEVKGIMRQTLEEKAYG